VIFPTNWIKQAILHPEQEVRAIALLYFTESFSDDPAVMPFVIQAVERYGKQISFHLLRYAERLCQTPATVDWLISQLRGEFDTTDINQDNLRFALALILCHAKPELLAHRHGEIMSTAAFPESLKEPLRECLKMEFSDWPTLWRMFEELGRQTMENKRLSRADYHRYHRIMRALARHTAADADLVLSLLRRDYRGHDRALMVWLESCIVELAGRLRLVDAIPLILQRIEADKDAVLDEIGSALIRIGGDAVVTAVIERWPSACTESRYLLAEALQNIHTDAAHKHLLDCLKAPDEFDLEICITNCALGHFSQRAIEAARQLLLEFGEREMGGEHWGLRYHLIAAATLMEETFPEYEAWHDEAVTSNYGRAKLRQEEPRRLADAFTGDEEAPSPSSGGRGSSVSAKPRRKLPDQSSSSGSGDSASSANQKEKESVSTISVSVAQLRKAFEENEVAANMKYKGKTVRVEGIVAAIKVGSGRPHVYLRSEYHGVDCAFKDSDNADLARLSKGSLVVVQGDCTGMFYGTVAMDNCRLMQGRS
jgi:hypothetical protein